MSERPNASFEGMKVHPCGMPLSCPRRLNRPLYEV